MSDTISKRDGGHRWTVELNKAYQKGQKRREKNMSDPTAPGGPKDDGYERMTKEEREEYKRGFRGD